ncbi:MAG: NAD(P)H-quinone oxidoreductase [Deltaproteobacteria bacterium]|nr:NAD(P)H-quinone oxidoreductase [Deltaproteobacteria bacterium]
MRYINISKHGEPEVMEVKEGEAPDPAKGEVLIRVHAAGVNRPDVMQRQGLYPPPPDASPILGLEVSGEVAATGDDVSAWSVSDRVCALTNGGGYAEYVAVPAGQCLPVPEGLPVEEAAALPETFFTVWANVFDRARLKPGETFLVHGGSSGIGTTAIQLAKSMGAKVFTTAGSAEKCASCQRLGADVAVNYTEQDYVKVLKEATDGQGVDVILDMVGGDYVARNLELAAMDGRMVSISFLKGSRVEIDMMHILRKRLIITGSTLRPRSAEAKAGIAQNLRAQVWPLIESGKIKPLIAARFPLADVYEAHKLMESSIHIGKIILTVAD